MYPHVVSDRYDGDLLLIFLIKHMIHVSQEMLAVSLAWLIHQLMEQVSDVLSNSSHCVRKVRRATNYQ